MTVHHILRDNDLHRLDVDGERLLFHIPSTSLFGMSATLDATIDLLARHPGLSQQQIHAQLQPTHPAGAVSEALAELRTLQLLGETGNEPRGTPPLALANLPLTTVVLNVNTGCNLSCSYCYKEDLDTPANGRKMALQTAMDAIEMLLRESPDQPRYNVVFFGGEPLTNLSLIREVIDFAEQRIHSLGRQVDFSLTTNATLLNDDVIHYLDAHRVGIAVSLDGPAAYHDRNRITVGGKGTYATVARKVERLLNLYRSRPVGARVTLTRGITDIGLIWDHLFNELGFAEVGFAPVTSGDMAEYNLTGDELKTVFANMKSLGEKYLAAALENRNIGFSNLHQLLTDLHEGNRKTLPCGAGVGMVAVDHLGDVNLCHRFTGSDLQRFGDVARGVDKPALNQFLNERLVQSDKGCNTCRIRNLCAGGCYHESYARYGDPSHPTFHYCELMRDWVDFGVAIYSKIMAHNPDFFPTHIAPRRAA